MLDSVVQLFQQVWEEGSAPSEWKDAMIVLIHKKGDLSLCDSWHGINLLDVGGKRYAKIIQCGLQAVAEEVLLDSQRGFRHGRGCVDMIFSARQAIEHHTKTFMLFVDLQKAYDSIPRRVL